jgi:hypothetical protein
MLRMQKHPNPISKSGVVDAELAARQRRPQRPPVTLFRRSALSFKVSILDMLVRSTAHHTSSGSATMYHTQRTRYILRKQGCARLLLCVFNLRTCRDNRRRENLQEQNPVRRTLQSYRLDHCEIAKRKGRPSPIWVYQEKAQQGVRTNCVSPSSD